MDCRFVLVKRELGDRIVKINETDFPKLIPPPPPLKNIAEDLISPGT